MKVTLAGSDVEICSDVTSLNPVEVDSGRLFVGLARGRTQAEPLLLARLTLEAGTSKKRG